MTKQEALLQIYEKHGKLTPELVVDEAKDKNSPLYEYFDWNNKEAGQKWRIHQARLLICRVKIISETAKGQSTRLFIHNGENSNGRTYNPIDIVVKDPDEFEKTLHRFRSDCMAYTNRIRSLGEYKEHSEFIEAHMNRIEESLNELISLYSESVAV